MNQSDSFEKLVAAIADDPSLLLYTVDVIPDKANILPVTESTYRDSMFLDNRVAVSDPQWIVAPLWKTIEQVNPVVKSRSCNFIFHVGHCGSTIVTRLLESFEDILALREPLALRGVAAVKRDLEEPASYVSPDQYPALRDFVYAMVSRRFRPRQTVVVKGTSDVCNIAGELLERNEANRALLMYLGLEEFLTVMLRNPTRREETAHFVASRLRDLRANGVDVIPAVYSLNDGQRVVTSWLANLFWLTRARGEQARMIDFAAFLENPMDELGQACEFLGIPQNESKVKAVIDGPVLKAYSKDPRAPYNPASRKAELAEARIRFGNEIESAMKWAAKTCRQSATLQPLLDYF